MTNSTRIAGLVGPTLVAIFVTEWMNLGGLGRMVAPVSAQQAGQSPTVVYASLVVPLAIGVVLTFKSYGRSENRADV